MIFLGNTLFAACAEDDAQAVLSELRLLSGDEWVEFEPVIVPAVLHTPGDDVMNDYVSLEWEDHYLALSGHLFATDSVHPCEVKGVLIIADNTAILDESTCLESYPIECFEVSKDRGLWSKYTEIEFEREGVESPGCEVASLSIQLHVEGSL